MAVSYGPEGALTVDCDGCGRTQSFAPPYKPSAGAAPGRLLDPALDRLIERELGWKSEWIGKHYCRSCA